MLRILFADTVDQRVKSKANESLDKYLDLAREMKKLWNKKVREISILVGFLRKDPHEFWKVSE